MLAGKRGFQLIDRAVCKADFAGFELEMIKVDHDGIGMRL